jgi:hypothetical protein
MSCSPIIKKIGGIKNPKLETVQSINSYGTTINIDSSNIVFAKDSSCLFALNRMFNGNPEILVFDSKKKYFPYKNDSVACNAPIDAVLANICNISNYDVTTTKKIDYDVLISSLADKNNALSSYSLNAYDYVVFVDFCKYTYGLNKTHIIPWNKVIKESKTACRVKYFYVNLDYLKFWGIKKKSLPRLRVKL